MAKPPDEPKMGKILDLRDRLPPTIFGDDASGQLAVKILKTIIENDDGSPHVWLASLMMVSRTLQRMLEEGYKVDALKMALIREKAMEIADSMQINIDYKNFGPLKDPTPPDGTPPKGA